MRRSPAPRDGPLAGADIARSTSKAGPCCTSIYDVLTTPRQASSLSGILRGEKPPAPAARPVRPCHHAKNGACGQQTHRPQHEAAPQARVGDFGGQPSGGLQHHKNTRAKNQRAAAHLPAGRACQSVHGVTPHQQEPYRPHHPVATKRTGQGAGQGRPTPRSSWRPCAVFAAAVFAAVARPCNIPFGSHLRERQKACHLQIVAPFSCQRGQNTREGARRGGARVACRGGRKPPPALGLRQTMPPPPPVTFGRMAATLAR